MNTVDAKAIEHAFDRSYYMTRYPDVRAAGLDPLQHYCENGWREGRHPSATFDTAYYLQANQDVRQAGINPLLHYVYRGRAEGRPTRPAMAWIRQHLAEARPARIAQAHGTVAVAVGQMPLRVDDLVLAFRNQNGLVISVSHDDFAVNVGGVQNVVSDECAALQRRGFDYLHLSPAQPGPGLAEATQAGEVCVSVRLNGTKFGIVKASALRPLLRGFAGHSRPTHWVIHHLMGHSPEVLATLIEDTESRKPLLWAHDFFAACPSYTLMRNDIVFCNAPPLASDGCRICVNGGERGPHALRIQAFVEKVRPSLIAPSQSAAELWRRSVPVRPVETIILPPADMALQASRRASRGGRPLRIAHIGARVFHKGWFVFQELAQALRGDARYEFFQFGSISGPELDFIRHVDVRVTLANRDAMVSALVENEVDVAIFWCLWPETFNFTLHEAIAAGTFVLARRDQGNVWAAARSLAPKASRAFDDEASLLAYLRGDAFPGNVDRAPLYRGGLLPNMGCADLLSNGKLQEVVA
ncbi:MAG: hypothetical protein EOP76_14925 [Variovorax sp.]|nr:MAG: hypothetical protein EOP76_14925 [Variovorax sp.]